MSNKDKILEAATELFHLHGYDRTSIDMLIKKAGVSKSNFYYYFEGKEELGLSILTTLADNQIRELSEIMESDLNPVEQILECHRRTVSLHRNLLGQDIYGGSFFGNLALEQSSVNEKFRSVLEKYFQESEALIEGSLRRGIEQGFFRDDIDPGDASRFLHSQIEGAVLMAKIKKSLSPIEDVMKVGHRFFLKEEWLHLMDEG